LPGFLLGGAARQSCERAPQAWCGPLVWVGAHCGLAHPLPSNSMRGIINTSQCSIANS